MSLASWLETSRERFTLSLAIAGFLLERGYDPVMTAPEGASDQPRRDHTVAIIEQLLDWKEALPALRVFSWGPIFRAYKGTWEDALDVELLGLPEPTAHEETRELVRQLVSAFPLAGTTRMVLGHARLTRLVLEHYGVGADEQDAFLHFLRQGQPLEAETRLERLDPRLVEIFQPLTAADFQERLSRILGPDWLKRREVADLLAWSEGPWQATRFDLSLTGAFDYYDGVVFHLYAEGWGQECIAGGQYRLLVPQASAAVVGIGFVAKPEVWPKSL